MNGECCLLYTSNANRKFCTKYGISTSFVRKDRAARDESFRKVLRSELSKESATRLEGSFGTQKQHYSLSRIKARNRKLSLIHILREQAGDYLGFFWVTDTLTNVSYKKDFFVRLRTCLLYTSRCV